MERLGGLPDTHLLLEVRLVLIQQLLEQRGFVRVRDLAERFGVSTVTVRTDLQLLEERQLAFRVHGGAMPFNGARGERTFEEVAERQASEKMSIASAAAALVANGETIVIDVGTTAAAFAQAIVDRLDLQDLTVLTNGLKIALLLEAAHPRFTIVVTGGTLRPKQHSLVEPQATDMFRSLRVDSVFLGCNGVSTDGGVTNINLPEAIVKRAMIASAARCVVMADSTKLGVRTLAPVCDLEQIDVLVTDGGADAGDLEVIRAHGVDVVVAEQPAVRDRRVERGIDQRSSGS
ncbi:MAG TPA: DeoR/GlpR family DNA-binding transcription regulator [Ilumatobacter sp.]|nr:DeoR/GlpR family DNA-binding transcription regulator [Ilumatobacter sp.]